MTVLASTPSTRSSDEGGVAEAIAAARGRAVTFVDVPSETFDASLRGLLPDWQVDGLLEVHAHYSRGEAADVLPTVAEVTGRAPRAVEEFARDYADAFR